MSSVHVYIWQNEVGQYLLSLIFVDLWHTLPFEKAKFTVAIYSSETLPVNFLFDRMHQHNMSDLVIHE